MAKKKSFFGTLLKLGGIAAAGAAVYMKRDEIKTYLASAVERFFPEEGETPTEEEMFAAEPDVVIDTTAKTEENEETEKEAPEA